MYNLVPSITETRYMSINGGFSQALIDNFISYTDRKPSTMKGYINCIRQFAKWLIDNDISQPTREDIKNYKKYLCNSDLSAGTQHQYLRTVIHFFKWTSSEGLYPNIAENIHTAKVRQGNHKKDCLQREDVKSIADTIERETEQGKRLYAMYLLAITCGLRCVEIHRANLEDIKTIGGKTYLYIQGKGHDDKDEAVLLVGEVLEAINDYLSVRTGEGKGKAPLFTGTSNRSKGKRISETTLSTLFKHMFINAGYNSSRITAHSLRHTSGTGVYKATGNLFLAQKHQRHADPSTTEIYIHAEERENRNTEQVVYDYYFKGQEEDIKEQAIRLLNTLDNQHIEKVINYINLIKSN